MRSPPTESTTTTPHHSRCWLPTTLTVHRNALSRCTGPCRFGLADSWLPGYREYLDAIAELDACIMQVMKQRRAALATAVASAAAAPQQQTPLPPASPTAAAVSAASGLSAGGGGEQQQQQQHYDILAFLLRAQQQQGVEAIPDKQVSFPSFLAVRHDGNACACMQYW